MSGTDSRAQVRPPRPWTGHRNTDWTSEHGWDIGTRTDIWTQAGPLDTGGTSGHRRDIRTQVGHQNTGIPGYQIKPPPFCCPGAEVLGNSICAIISLDSSTMASVCDRLNGHLLPRTLRRFLWMDKLLRSEKNFTEGNINIIEKEARERYGRTLEHRCDELKLRSPTRSPISGLIENAVVEKFGNTPSMYPFASDEEMINESSKTFNVLYVYNGLYEPYLIHWLFPLQMAFRQTPTTELLLPSDPYV
ncbi:uncharacterized protein [Dendrobates tinctorius]|uniref:uncharacterized protein n=1 Tax=Dendrobates tinctorius TaxID=92724 RepID=UPI003CCA63E1